MSTKVEATIEDLYNVPDNGKAEIVDGELILMSPTGDLPGTAALEIVVSLREQSRRTGYGRAYGDNVGFVVNQQDFLQRRHGRPPSSCDGAGFPAPRR